MRLLRCPVGFIGTKVGPRTVHIDKLPYEKRGYTLVDDATATELIKRDGYEIINKEEYPRDLTDLYHEVKRQLTEKGIFTRIEEESISHTKAQAHTGKSPRVHVQDGEWVESTTPITVAIPSLRTTPISKIKKCWLCGIHDKVNSLFRRKH